MPNCLRLAGSMKLPGDSIEADAVGKFGKQDNAFNHGRVCGRCRFESAGRPGVFETVSEAAFLWNPVQEDIDLVRHIAGFKRPELKGERTDKKPNGEDNPGAFAMMLLGDFHVGQKELL
ncbi:MAG: hypothetical protein U5P10_08290 [Spirochaetia bacterium]|nr:hypothetical protein [Spirochaetia bacterium]